jgi:uncharacterized protein YdeI (BOF family)
MDNRHRTTCLALLAGIALALAPAVAQAAKDVNPYMKPDDTWIRLSGTVKTVSPDTFTLDYGKGSIVVEMDDGDRDADAYKLLPGDKVTVSGMIDDDLFETRTIEAASVYVEKLGTYFYASAVDEEDAFVTLTTPVVVTATEIQGTVTEVRDHEFVVNTGLRSITVDVSHMLYDPLDDEGYQKVEVGDVVSVTGSMEDDLFEGRELVASSVVTIAG